MKFVSTLLTASALFGLSSSAFAGECKDVKIDIKNLRAQEIKIYKCDYWDTEQAKWRTESISEWKIASKTSEYKIQDLEYVKNQDVKMKCEWSYNTGGSQWSDKKWTATSDSKMCSGGQVFHFDVE